MSELRKTEDEVSDIKSSYHRLLHGLKFLISDHPAIKLLPELVEQDEVLENTDEQTPSTLYNLLQEFVLRERAMLDGPQLEKFRKRSKEKDPITGNPRYGERTMGRVMKLLESHETLSNAIDIMHTVQEFRPHVNTDVFNLINLSLYSDVKCPQKLSLADYMKMLADGEERKRQKDAEMKLSREEVDRLEELRRIEVEKEAKSKSIEEKKRQEEERAKKLEVERLKQVIKDEHEKRIKEEEEQRRLEEEQKYIDSIVKGTEGVKIQMKCLRESCGEDMAAYRVAARSLHILFSQILARPEELRFRLIRSNHPQFHEDIGRWTGGREILIAAGFEIIKIDEITCYVTKEPSLEQDMDAWSAWFDGLKSTVEIVED